MVVSLLAVITPAGAQLVAARSWFVAADLRVVEEMSAGVPAGTEEPAGGFDLDVCELERGPAWSSPFALSVIGRLAVMSLRARGVVPFSVARVVD